MSREFGSYNSGYFHTQMEQGADDCLNGSAEITKKWGEFLKHFSEIAYAIATSEAGDSSETFPIMKTIEKIEDLDKALSELKRYVSPFKECMQEAVEEALKQKKL